MTQPQSATHPAPRRHRVGLSALSFAMFGAPFAWSVQIIVDYALLAHACFPTWYPVMTPESGAAWWISLIVSVVALVVGLAALGVAARGWRRTRAEQTGHATSALEVAEGRTRFVMLCGILLSALFSWAIILNGLGLFLTSPCGV